MLRHHQDPRPAGPGPRPGLRPEVGRRPGLVRAGRRVGAALLAVDLLSAGGLLAARLAAAPGGARVATARSSSASHPAVAPATPSAGPVQGSGTSTDNTWHPVPLSTVAPASPPTAPTGGPNPPGHPSPGSDPSGPAQPGSNLSGPAGSGATRSGTSPAPPVSAEAVPAPSSAPISCATDLPLAQAPDSGYNFLCTQGGRPVTWSINRIVIYQAGLSLLQQVAFGLAVAQWAPAAGFEVSYTSSPAAADVTVTAAALGAGQPGFVEDGYTTVGYRCDPGCAYDTARVELSSSATLVQTDWVSTILHELGHVAGLNHVSRLGEVMYPYLSLDAPVTYAAGDLEGLRILASERGA